MASPTRAQPAITIFNPNHQLLSSSPAVNIMMLLRRCTTIINPLPPLSLKTRTTCAGPNHHCARAQSNQQH
jgi:hypothetical protein